MPSSDEIRSESNKLSEFFKDGNQYQIPLHQREYDWELVHLQEFWSDLINHIDTPDTEKYFFGTVILVKENSKEPVFTVIDGQQRLSTSVIFITVLRDFLDEKHRNITEKISELDSLEARTEDDKKELNYLNEQKLECRDDLRTLEKMVWIKDMDDAVLDKPRLSVNLYNDEFFTREIIPKLTISEKFNKLNELEDIKKKNEKIKNCYTFFYEKLQELDSATSKDPTKRIRKIWNSFVYDFMLAEITINNLDHAYKIFENINNKGKRLATNNLVKNKLYEIIASKGVSRSKQMEILSGVDHKWQAMVETLEETHSKNAHEDIFLKHYLSAFVQPTKSSKVYSTIKEKYTERETASTLIEQLSKTSSDYAAIIEPDMSDWFNNEDLVDNLKSLNVLGKGAVYPIILLAKSYKFDANNMKLLIRFLTKFFFRCKTICNINYSYIEPLVGRVCTHMRKNKNSTDLDVLMDMMTKDWEKYPEDDEFEIKFKSHDFPNDIARYPLKEIHYYNMGKKETNTTKIRDSADIEHIMPQTLNVDWINEIKITISNNKKQDAINKEKKNNPKYELKDIEKRIGKQEFPVSTAEINNYQDQNYKKLANLTLLNSFKNKAILNFSFARKCEKYKEDDLEMTKKLADYDEWNHETIAKRQNELAVAALQVWDLINNRN